jgi:hypothetical protein
MLGRVWCAGEEKVNQVFINGISLRALAMLKDLQLGVGHRIYTKAWVPCRNHRG